VNYRHAFHAGGFVDVVKHLILTRILAYLAQKPAAFRVIDTHAGIGRYDLESQEAQRSPEWREGIGRLLETPLTGRAGELAKPYLDTIARENPKGGVRYYPGSPLLTRHLLREQDRLFALELHPEDQRKLAKLFAGDIQVRVTEIDGWLALGAYLPPKERRGLVLIDPPFEEKGEFSRLAEGLVVAHRKWATGIYALWYPLKDRRQVNGFIADIKASGITRVLRAELTVRRPQDGELFGTGMLIVNPPFTLEDELKVLLPALSERLAQEGRGGWTVDWVRGES
jgi:23S rRNA (adenine2030-N6)-methyltransferase